MLNLFQHLIPSAHIAVTVMLNLFQHLIPTKPIKKESPNQVNDDTSFSTFIRHQ